MRKRRLHQGTTTVEFAIVAVALFLLVFAILEFSRVVFTMNLLQEGARRGGATLERQVQFHGVPLQGRRCQHTFARCIAVHQSCGIED